MVVCAVHLSIAKYKRTCMRAWLGWKNEEGRATPGGQNRDSKNQSVKPLSSPQLQEDSWDWGHMQGCWGLENSPSILNLGNFKCVLNKDGFFHQLCENAQEGIPLLSTFPQDVWIGHISKQIGPYLQEAGVAVY